MVDPNFLDQGGEHFEDMESAVLDPHKAGERAPDIYPYQKGLSSEPTRGPQVRAPRRSLGLKTSSKA